MKHHLKDLSDDRRVARLLQEGGLSREAATAKSSFYSSCADSLISQGRSTSSESISLFVPGRIEVLGKHTDYAGGRSMVSAAERGFCLVACPRRDKSLTMRDLVRKSTATVQLDARRQPSRQKWANYPLTVARRVARNFSADVLGADIAFASDLPSASGMSSSSALVVATFLAISLRNNLPARVEYRETLKNGEGLAGYLGTIENGQDFGPFRGDVGVGTFGGSEDHTGILLSKPGIISQYSYCPVRLERHVRVPVDLCFVIGVSGVLADKTGSAKEKYNRQSRLLGAILESWKETTGRDDTSLAEAAHSSPKAPDEIREILRRDHGGEFSGQDLVDRFDHYWSESELIIPRVPDALEGEGPLKKFGDLAAESQRLAEVYLGNQVAETAALARGARLEGALAASAFGGGFGGSVWALVPSVEARGFLSRWSRKYLEEFPDCVGSADFFVTRPGPGAFALGDDGLQMADCGAPQPNRTQ